MKISIYDELYGSAELTVGEMRALAQESLSLAERVPGVEGKAFDINGWYKAWRRQPSGSSQAPAYMTVEASDEFQATIPWGQLSKAVFLYEQNGLPLQKGFPLRLYVPDGSSECLNVKSVVKIRFGYNKNEVSANAVYGFKNEVSLDSLKLKK